MWSRKPMPVLRSPAPVPSRVSVRRTSVSRVARSIEAVRVVRAAMASPILAHLHRRRVASKPSARAMGAPARRAPPPRGPIRTSAMRRRKHAGRQAGGEARGAAGGQRVVRARDVVAEGDPALAPDEHAAGRSDARGERLGRGAGQLEVLGREGLREGQRGLGVGGPARAPRPRRSSSQPPSTRRATSSSSAGSSETAAHDRAGPVLGLGQEVERDPSAARPRWRRRARRWGRGSRRCRRRPATRRLASCTQTPPGPATTSDARDGLGPVGERGDGLGAARRGRPGRPRRARRRRGSPGATPGAATTTSSTSAARAVTTPMTTVLG